MYNEKIKASIYKYYENNKEKVDQYRRAYYAERMEDPEFKAKEKERIRICSKERYDNDAEFRAKKNERRRALYYKKKEELLAQKTLNAVNIMPIAIEATA